MIGFFVRGDHITIVFEVMSPNELKKNCKR